MNVGMLAVRDGSFVFTAESFSAAQAFRIIVVQIKVANTVAAGIDSKNFSRCADVSTFHACIQICVRMFFLIMPLVPDMRAGCRIDSRCGRRLSFTASRALLQPLFPLKISTSPCVAIARAAVAVLCVAGILCCAAGAPVEGRVAFAVLMLLLDMPLARVGMRGADGLGLAGSFVAAAVALHRISDSYVVLVRILVHVVAVVVVLLFVVVNMRRSLYRDCAAAGGNLIAVSVANRCGKDIAARLAGGMVVGTAVAQVGVSNHVAITCHLPREGIIPVAAGGRGRRGERSARFRAGRAGADADLQRHLLGGLHIATAAARAILIEIVIFAFIDARGIHQLADDRVTVGADLFILNIHDVLRFAVRTIGRVAVEGNQIRLAVRAGVRVSAGGAIAVAVKVVAHGLGSRKAVADALKADSAVFILVARHGVRIIRNALVRNGAAGIPRDFGGWVLTGRCLYRDCAAAGGNLIAVSVANRRGKDIAARLAGGNIVRAAITQVGIGDHVPVAGHLPREGIIPVAAGGRGRRGERSARFRAGRAGADADLQRLLLGRLHVAAAATFAVAVEIVFFASIDPFRVYQFINDRVAVATNPFILDVYNMLFLTVLSVGWIPVDFNQLRSGMRTGMRISTGRAVAVFVEIMPDGLGDLVAAADMLKATCAIFVLIPLHLVLGIGNRCIGNAAARIPRNVRVGMRAGFDGEGCHARVIPRAGVVRVITLAAGARPHAVAVTGFPRMADLCVGLAGLGAITNGCIRRRIANGVRVKARVRHLIP